MLTASVREEKIMESQVYPYKPIAVGERRAMLSLTNSTAVVLFEYYRYVTRKKNFVITDKKTAEDLGLSVATAKKSRLLLQKHNYFHVVHSKTKNLETYYYFLGVDAVMRAKYYDKVFGSVKTHDIRRQVTPEKAIALILANNVPKEDRIDLILSLRVKTRANKKSFPKWNTVSTQKDYEQLEHDLQI